MRWGWWWLLIRRLPIEMIADTTRVLAAAVHRSPPSGRFRTVAFEAGGDDTVSASRRALVIFGASIAPDAYVVSDRTGRGCHADARAGAQGIVLRTE